MTHPTLSPTPFEPSPLAQAMIQMEALHGASIYHPLPLAAARAEGAWIWDLDGRVYLDMMSAYSAVSLGHARPELIEALTRQASLLAVTSRAYHNDQLPYFLKELALATGLPKAIPMNSGAEAVETAIKAARKWGEKVKGVPARGAEIVVCHNNFHGRTSTIVGFSSEEQYKEGFGPFCGGFVSVPHGDSDAFEAAITDRTCAIIVEPIQGEAGIVIPPPGYLARLREICQRRRVLLIVDEIQTGFGRAGEVFAHRAEIDSVDGMILGKALGGGLLPVSAFCGTEELMGVFHAGDHGSTFGGNPLACAVARAALPSLIDPELAARSRLLGLALLAKLRALLAGCPFVVDIRGRGLFAAIEVAPEASARELAESLLGLGLLSKETHGTVLRLAPPLTIGYAELDFATTAIGEAFARKARALGLAWTPGAWPRG